jgi:hypothetical protein
MSPFASCTADGVGSQPGISYLHAEVEPWIAVNPMDPLNVVALWQQDRWSNGGARGLVAGVSEDGGSTWSSVVLPGLTPCSGGADLRATDPWLSFAPNGDLHAAALAFGTGPAASNAVVTIWSRDGGFTWSPWRTLIRDTWPHFNDKESITTDPTDPRYVYATWDRLNPNADRGPSMFARSFDRGVSWEPAVAVHDPGPGSQTLGGQIVVHPDGRLFLFFTEIVGSGDEPGSWLAFKESADKGATWTPESGAARVAPIAPRRAVAPGSRFLVRDGANLFDVGADPASGALVAVWQTAGPEPDPIPVVAFSMSTDGGRSWSDPVAVNRTPADLPPGSRQAFSPSVHVAEGGAVAVTYYDFRHDDPAPEALTDHWLTWCHPQAADCANPERWRDEVRLTEASFDILQAPSAGGLFLGDYFGLGSAGKEFVALFTQPHAGDPASAFARRVLVEEALAPEELAFWKQEVSAAAGRIGGGEETRASFNQYLADIRAVHDVFDRVRTFADLRDLLRPRNPPLRGQVRRELMALLLNLFSSRLSPSADVGDGMTAGEAAASVAAALMDRRSPRADLEAARDLARAIDEGRFLALSPASRP